MKSVLLPLCCIASAFTRDSFTTVITADIVRNRCYRIPTLAETPSGILLAFMEERVGVLGCRDEGSGHNLVLKRSTDGGATWGPLIRVVGSESNLRKGGVGYSNPMPVCCGVANRSQRLLL